jgi:recombination protein U
MSISERGKALESLVDSVNAVYCNRGIAFVERLETSTAKHTEKGDDGKYRTKVTFIERPRLDYIARLYGGRAIDFDCKETADPAGLPLKDIRDTQYHFFRMAAAYNWTAFLVVYSSAKDEYYRADKAAVLRYHEIHRENPRVRGACRVPWSVMETLEQRDGIALDYLRGYYSLQGPAADMDKYNAARFRDGER